YDHKECLELIYSQIKEKSQRYEHVEGITKNQGWKDTGQVLEEEAKDEFICPICRDVLLQPVETMCEHHFCGECFKQAMLSSGIPVECPVCKTELNTSDHIKRQPFVRGQSCPSDCGTSYPCSSSPITLEEAMEQLRQGNISPEMEKVGTLFVKSKMKSSEDGKTAMLKTRGKPLRLVTLPQPQKPSDEVSPRQVRNRMKALQTLGTAVSGGRSNIHLIQQVRAQKQECRQLLKEALGRDLELQVVQKVGSKIDSEKKQRLQKTEQIGDNLESEMLPLEHTEKRGNKLITVIKQTPCAFVGDLQDKITSYTPNANMADHSDGPGRVARKRETSSLSICSALFRYALRVVVSLNATRRERNHPRERKCHFFEFPRTPLRRKQWIHAIRRDEGKEFTITEGTKVCSLHFRREDLRKSFKWTSLCGARLCSNKICLVCSFPEKRKGPPERHPLPKKKLFTSASTHTESQETIVMVESLCESTSSALIDEPNPNIETNESNVELNAVDYRKQLEEMEQELINLRLENIELKEKLAEGERQQERYLHDYFPLNASNRMLTLTFIPASQIMPL
ncbi:hypothetical protein OS493_038394, partial [Desmophyllum pertusum]